MNITIRPAVTADAAPIASLLTDIAELHRRGRPDIFSAPGAKLDEAGVEMLLSCESSPVLVAEADGAFAGYAICELVDSPEHPPRGACRTLFIEDLCVASDMRGSGVGAALFGASKELAKKLGAVRLELNVWAFNQKAVGFYEAMGMAVQRQIMELKYNDRQA